MSVNREQMIADAEQCLGWPYVSPGSNDSRGIDCSGLFVYLFGRQGESVYHGSNTIWRTELRDRGALTGVSDLRPGMAVFKWKNRDTSRYTDGLGDFHHIGLVASVSPVRVIHASSVRGEVVADDSLDGWTHWGEFKAVEPEKTPEPGDRVCLTAVSGSTVNIRRLPGGALLERLPIGTAAEAVSVKGSWTEIRYEKTGWVRSEYLKEADE